MCLHAARRMDCTLALDSTARRHGRRLHWDGAEASSPSAWIDCAVCVAVAVAVMV